MINEQRSEGQAVGRGRIRERRADAEQEKAAKGSARVDIMRNRGAGMAAVGEPRPVKGRNEKGWRYM